MSPCSLLPLLPATQPLQFQVLTYCDDFVEYHDKNEMNRLIEQTGMIITDRRIEGNHEMEETNQGSTDRDETKTDSSKSKVSQKGKPRRKEQEFKEYTRIYIYQHDRYKKSRKRASGQANKRKTKEGKFLEGPAKDDDTYMSSNSSANEWERVGQPAQPQRTARKAARKVSRKTPAVRRRRTKKRLVRRKARKHKNKKSGLAIQVDWSGQIKQRYLECLVLVPGTISNGCRVWDGKRTEREGGGKAATVTRFRIW
jgi:hypothetical protein